MKERRETSLGILKRKIPLWVLLIPLALLLLAAAQIHSDAKLYTEARPQYIQTLERPARLICKNLEIAASDETSQSDAALSLEWAYLYTTRLEESVDPAPRYNILGRTYPLLRPRSRTDSVHHMTAFPYFRSQLIEIRDEYLESGFLDLPARSKINRLAAAFRAFYEGLEQDAGLSPEAFTDYMADLCSAIYH